MNGINRELIREHNKKFWTFRNFIMIIGGFNSIMHYKKWLAGMSAEDKTSTESYYLDMYMNVLKIAE